jgi:hypothetical protein
MLKYHKITSVPSLLQETESSLNEKETELIKQSDILYYSWLLMMTNRIMELEELNIRILNGKGEKLKKQMNVTHKRNRKQNNTYVASLLQTYCVYRCQRNEKKEKTGR